MAGPLNAKVIMARCSKNKKSFGIRIEQRGGDWIRTWAFPMDERKAKREKFDANTITGSLEEDDKYPGCPHCGSMGFVQCGCEKIGCNGGVRVYDDDTAEYTCPWCGNEIGLQAADSFDVSGGGY
jgi:DNA-directed RNA polymerase subunit RPC12/RpoP